MAPFDPYHKWLGIPPEEQPAHHYRLLGIKLFEFDADVIDAAAEQRTVFLRSFQSGPNAELAERLLNDGETTMGGRVPVNPSGGLACFGEAVPAQAISQVCELTWQLRGAAGDRQVEGAKVGLTVNQGLFGHGSSVIVTS